MTLFLINIGFSGKIKSFRERAEMLIFLGNDQADQGACKITLVSDGVKECLSVRVRRACKMSAGEALLRERKMEMLFFHDVNNKVPSTPQLLQSEHISATDC